MKIVHVITGLGRGGAEGALYRLAVTQIDEGVTVVSLMTEGIYGPRLRDAGVEVVALGVTSPVSALQAIFRLRNLLKKNRPDLVQTWMYHADLIGGLAASSLSIPVCWGIRNSGGAMHRKWTSRAILWACAALSRFIPDRIVCCSRRAVTAHREAGYRAVFEVIPNGVDVSRWSGDSFHEKSNGSDQSIFVFAHAARKDPQKDHATLAAAFSIAYEKDSSLRLLMCGEGLTESDPYFRDLPFSRTARDGVRPLGPRDDLPALWKEANAFVLSSVAEGFPNVVAEAMAAGLPCVVTDVGDAAYIVGDTGSIVPASDPEQLAHAMLDMRRLSPQMQAQLSAAARRRVARCFTQERTADGFRKVWREVVAARRTL